VSSSSISLHVLGTVGTLQVSGERLPGTVLERIRDRWEALDEAFDLASPGSQLGLLAAGAISILDTSAEVQAAYTAAIRWRINTGGAFRVHRADGVLDLGRIAEGFALRDAAAALTRAGVESWLVSIGPHRISDALGGAAWAVEIHHPHDEHRILAEVPLGGSWTAAGTHRASVQATGSEFDQVSVFGRDVVTAHALAGAVLSGGAPALDAATERWPIDVLTVDREGEVRATTRLARQLRIPALSGADGRIARAPVPL
jgi:thiamine biosynthesis lipoprotein